MSTSPIPSHEDPHGQTGSPRMTEEAHLETRKMTVAQVIDECPSIKTLVLESSPAHPLPPWQPGSHVELTLPSGLARKYSLCGDPSDTSHYRVAVFEDPNSRGGSAEIHRVARPGLELSVSGPRNLFPLADATHYLFVAGGIGITPILPMIRSLEASGGDWHLVYGGRSRRAMAFLSDIANFDQHRVDVVTEDESGMIDIARVLEAQPMGTTVYCCGPGAMIAAIRDAAATLPQVSAVKFELFAALEPASLPADDETEFTVDCSRSGVRITVPAGRSILEVVREQVEPTYPFDCEAGYCGSCEVAVLGGQPEHRDDFLTEAERESNTVMMICVGRSRSATLVLDL